MEKTYPINMKIPNAHLQIVSNECTNFLEKCIYPSLRTFVDKIMSTDERQTDRQTDGQTDRQGETKITTKTLYSIKNRKTNSSSYNLF